jgi:hypothetical protein
MMRLLMFLTALSCAGLSVATAEPYWVAYEGDDFPENVGWERHWGVHVPPGDPNSVPERSIEDGVFVLDTTCDIWLYDFYRISGLTNPGPGELFMAEWRVEVETQLTWWDASVGIARDDPPGDLQFRFGPETLFVEEGDVTYEIGAGAHLYRFESWDMDLYRLYVDGALTHEGAFQTPSGGGAFFGFGNPMAGASSRSVWDYVRFGVVPEPSAFLLLGYLIITSGRGIFQRR